MNKNMGRPVANRYKVPKTEWAKWSNHARSIFNEMMESMRPSMQFAFLHPDCPPMSKVHWQTTRWNAAWTAAYSANGKGALGKVVTVKNHSTRKRSK